MASIEAHSGTGCLEAVMSIFTDSAALDEQMKVVLFHKIMQKLPKLADKILTQIKASLQDSEVSDWQEQSFYMDGLLHGLELLEKGLSCGK